MHGRQLGLHHVMIAQLGLVFGACPGGSSKVAAIHGAVPCCWDQYRAVAGGCSGRCWLGRGWSTTTMMVLLGLHRYLRSLVAAVALVVLSLA